MNKLNDQIKILYKELDPIKQELEVRKANADKIKDEIAILKN